MEHALILHRFDCLDEISITDSTYIAELKNKEIITKRFFELLKKGLFVPKERKATKIPKAAIRKRIKDKKSLGEIKKSRRKPNLD